MESKTFVLLAYRFFLNTLSAHIHDITLDPSKVRYLLIKNEDEKRILEILLKGGLGIVFEDGNLMKGEIYGHKIIDLSDGYIKNFSDFIKKTEENENE